jgi:hypothetical protein
MLYLQKTKPQTYLEVSFVFYGECLIVLVLCERRI